MSTPLAVFGPGILICTRTDISNGTPVNVGFAQEFQIEAAGTTKQLYGQNQLPLVAARSTIKTTGKFKSAVLSGIAMNNLFWGQTNSTASGQIAWNIGSTFSLSTAAATQQVGSSLTFDADLGVNYASNGLPFRRVSTGSEVAGSYSVQSTSPGLYQFSAAETTGLTAGTTIPIKVTYSNTTTSGTSLLVTNQLIGTSPTFQLDYYTNLNQPTAKPFIVRCYAAIASKMSLQFKLEDFMMPEYDFDLFANNAGQLVNQVFPEIS
jgi:hypothetical protein